MHHPPLTINGVAISFAHLTPITRRVTLELQGDLRKAVAVEFNFSCHCYSRGLSEGEVVPPGWEVPDGSKHAPRPRVFDPERYELSKELVALLDRLIADNAIVTKSRHDNFYRVDDVQTVRDGTTQTVSYFIFMHARKVDEPNRPKSIRVQVESAYPEADAIPHPVGQGSRTFGRMLGEKWVPKKG